MKKILQNLVFLWAGVWLAACEDVIDVNLKQGDPQLAVDAFLTNLPGTQTIRLTITTPYLDNRPAPPALGATVTVRDNENNVFVFVDANNTGNYTWTPPINQSFGRIGNRYTLNIRYQGQEYEANSEMKRVPPIDSIYIEKSKGDRLGEVEGGYYPQVYVRDLPGAGDCYWLRGFKNGVFNNRPSALTVAYDAGFSPGGAVDGITLIRPLRESPFDFIDNTNNNPPLPPVEVGDSISVQMYSITEPTFFYFTEVINQLQNGGLFARPPANVPSNLRNLNSNSPVKAVGFFSVSAVSVAGTRVRAR